MIVLHEYAFETFHYADLKRELIAFDPNGGWDRFLDGWLLEHKDTDWSVENDRVNPAGAAGAGKSASIDVVQKGTIAEPTVLLYRSATGEIRVPIWPERGNYQVDGASVTRVPEQNRWVVVLNAPDAPTQVEVDPDHALLDAVPDNNRWKTEFAWRLTAMMTPLDESSQFQAHDRPRSSPARSWISTSAAGSRSASSGSTNGPSPPGPGPSRRSARRSSAARRP